MIEIAPIAVDAMGGDNAPAAIVQGAINAARKKIAVLLVGGEAQIRSELERLGAGSELPITVHHAPEVVEMADHPGQVMRCKKENSIRVCFELVKSGRASAMVSAGNSGAIMAGALFVLGRLDPVERPAILSVIPGLQKTSILLDVGANVECRPIHLVQFALLGEVYARRVMGKARPRVAILSNGEEESKGTDLTRTAAEALRGCQGLDFVGYCEGHDLLDGELDVVVTDGFTGNVVLKAMEGTVKAMGERIQRTLQRGFWSRVGGFLARCSLAEAGRRLDWREIGGAPLVGVKGVGVVSHGASDSRAIENAIQRAASAVRAHCMEEMAQAAGRAGGLLSGAATASASVNHEQTRHLGRRVLASGSV